MFGPCYSLWKIKTPGLIERFEVDMKNSSYMGKGSEEGESGLETRWKDLVGPKSPLILDDQRHCGYREVQCHP